MSKLKNSGLTVRLGAMLNLEDIDQKVLKRLKDKGYDSVAYLNNIEDPGSLSLIILDRNQAELAEATKTDYSGSRYRFHSQDETKIVERDSQNNILITPA